MSNQKQSVIFIVDDNLDNVKVLAKVLESSGYKTLVAMDGLSGIQKIIRAQPDLILLDVLMPNIDGLQTCKLLKENEITRHIPIIFMTALASTDDKVKGLKAGAVDYITKPFQRDELIARLELHLELRRLSEELAAKNQELQTEIDLRFSTEVELRKQFEREKLVTEITLNIRQSLDLSTILNTAVTSLKEILQVDRVLAYQIFADGTGKVIAEAVNEELDKILDIVFPQEIFPEEAYENYLQGNVRVFEDCKEMLPCLQDFMHSMGVKSKLVAPIFKENHVWGLIVAHQHTSYQWQQWQSDLVHEVSNQLAIAISQASLYQQAQAELIQRKQTEEKLLQLSKRLSLAVKSAEIGIWDWDVINNILVWDKRMYELYGINREQFQNIYEAWANTLHPDDRQITENAMQLALAGEKDYGAEFRVIHPNGSIHFIKAYGLVERDAQGSPQRMVGINYDITDRKQMELALQVLNQDLEMRVQERTAELAYSEQRLEKIVANISDGILIMNSHGVIVFANPSAERMLGLDGGNLRNFKTNIPFKNNEELEVQILAAPHKMGIAEIQRVEIDWDGSKHFLASLRDITERKENENLLREVLKQVQDYKYALDQSAIVYITDSLGVITYANENFYHLTGYDRTEVIGSTPRLVNSHYHPPEFYSQMWSEIASGRVWHGEIKNQRKDKNYYWIDITIIPFTNQKDKVEQYLAIQFNITDRKLIEEDRQKLDLLVKNSSEFIAIADLQGNITYLNEAGKQMIGIDEASLGNLTDYLKPALYSPEKFISDAVWQGAYEGECSINHLPTGTNIPTLCNIFLIKDRDGTPINIGAVSRDISKLKQAESEILNSLEKEKELSMLRSNFVSMASHELRTPLAIVSSSAGILESYSDRLTDAKKSQHLQRIQTSIKHMTELIDDVLVLNRAEVGRVEFHPETLDIVSFCRNLNEEIQLSTNEHKLEFNSQEDSILAPIDTKLIRQILTNILTNAIKYTPQGGLIKFDLSVTTENVVFQIMDSGLGISPEDLAALFSSFHRGSNVGTIPGNGLGLAIVKKCVDLHNGQISVKSEIETGSMFEVILPLFNQS